jgi:site-specific DNA-methyltransferase (adenine-specific)
LEAYSLLAGGLSINFYCNLLMIINEDILKWCDDRAWDNPPKFHAVLCDPPYELGFMGKSWDSTGIAFDKDTWKKIADQLYPGAYLLAFGGTRTYHRMACAIEDAGFEVRDMISWIYGSGFPKSLNIGKAVDKIQGNERETLEYATRPDGSNARVNVTAQSSHFGTGDSNDQRPTKGNSPYEGYGTALKPAHEPCVLARKPLEKGMTVATNALKHGTGGLNIDGSRVGTIPRKTGTKPTSDEATGSGHTLQGSSKNRQAEYDEQNLGRFPANLIHDNHPEVVGLFPNTKGSSAPRTNSPASKQVYGDYGQVTTQNDSWGDSGSAARFFKSCPLDDPNADIKRLFYSAKVSKRERDAGLDSFPSKKTELNSGGIGREISVEKRLENGDGVNAPNGKNVHPTLKPLSLTKYLATLILPPKLDQPRRLLVPFSGAGSEVIGALQAGWDEVVGVEQSKEYCEIAEARIKHWIK